MRLLLLPPDERPVHVRLPVLLADVAGVEVVLPPPHLRPDFRTPADVAALGAWVRATASEVDVAVVSLEALCLGGLVPSRLTDDRVPDAVARLQVLREVAAGATRPVLDLFGVVMRLPDIDDAYEEPPYWADHGRDLAALSRALHGRATGDTAADGLAQARAAVPAEHARDVFGRRLRNHALLLAALEGLVDGTLDRLVLSSDDTAPTGLPAFEGGLVDHWLRTLDVHDRVDRYPGADEVVGVRLARWARGAEERPTFALLDVAGLDRIAPYEDRPVADTAAGQIRAVGGRLLDGDAADAVDAVDAVDAADTADVVLAVLPPQDLGDWALAPPRRDVDAAVLDAFVARVRELVDAGRWVAVADCSSPNGGSPALLAALVDAGVASRLAAFSAWNTAGNTIGTAVAQAVVGRGRGGPGTAHERLLVHRMLEDVGYMAHERTALRERRRAAGVPVEPPAGDMPGVRAEVAEGLADRLSALGELGVRWRLTPDSVDLPWRRTFHVDFVLESAATPPTDVDRTAETEPARG